MFALIEQTTTKEYDMSKYNIIEGDGTLRATASSIDEAIQTTKVELFRNGIVQSKSDISSALRHSGTAQITDITFGVSFWIKKA
jgi:hypothetical protein